MSRVKETRTTLVDLQQVDEALREYGRLAARKAAIDGEMNNAVQALKTRHARKLMINEQTGETLVSRMEALSANILAYVEANRSLFPAESGPSRKRTLKLNHGSVGLRWSTPAVRTVKGMTFKAILGAEAMLQKLRRWEWVRTKEELDKQTILSEYATDQGATKKRLEQVGLSVEQDEEPWFESERVELSVVAEAASEKAA